MRERLEQALREAADGRDKTRAATLRLINAAVRDRDREARAKGRDQGVSDQEIVDTLLTLFLGGFESTGDQIAWSVYALLCHPDQLELLRSDPSMIGNAIEELLRWVSPIMLFRRTVVRNIELEGQPLREGDKVALYYTSANRDESHFTDPFTFDVRRSPNNHLAFGNGTHFCLGATLARQLLKLLFTSMTQRFTDLQVVSEPDVEPNLFARAVRSFELSFKVR